MSNRSKHYETHIMDLLTDILRQSGLRRRVLSLRHLESTSALQFPCNKSMGLHVVTHGEVCIHAPALAEPLRLKAGDIALMARGCLHTLSPCPSLQNSTLQLLNYADAPIPGSAGSDDPSCAVISGAYQFWNTPIHPFFKDMPDWFTFRAADVAVAPALPLVMELLAKEARQRQLGAETIVHGLLDAIFTYLLRDIVAKQSQAGAGWSHSVHDPQVRQSLVLMHDDFARAWTLGALAQACGLSRTGLAERFRKEMSDTPLNYLRTVRIQNAMRILSDTDQSLEQVAQAVGYQDAFSFSKAFKRTVGIAPRAFRTRDTEDQAQPWRFKAS